MEKINKLLENGLHDALITSLKYKDNNLYIKVDCGVMNLEKLSSELDSLSFIIECINISKLDFDFDGMMLIDNLTIEKDKNVVIKVSNGDLYLVCDDYKIVDVTETLKRNKESIMLEKILKTDI